MTVSTTYVVHETFSSTTGNGFINGTQSAPEVVALAGGGWAISYGTSTTGVAGGVFPLITAFDSQGNMLPGPVGNYYTPFTPTNSADVDMATAPALTVLADGNLLVIWNTAVLGGFVRGAIIDPADGSVLVPDFEVDQYNDIRPDVAALTGSTWVAVFQDTNTIYFQLMDGGTKVGPQSPFGGQDAAVIALSDGGFAISYTVVGAPDQDGVALRVLNADGTERLSVATIAPGGVDNGNSASAMALIGRWAHRAGLCRYRRAGAVGHQPADH